jgi:hypothetical protein
LARIWLQVSYKRANNEFAADLDTAIRDNWAGRPYHDLVKCLEHLNDIPCIDLDNAVAGGNSYGGYMMNWIQGHSLGRRVSHPADPATFVLP